MTFHRRRPDHPRHLPPRTRRGRRTGGAADLRERQHRPQRRQRGGGPGGQHAPAGRVLSPARWEGVASLRYDKVGTGQDRASARTQSGRPRSSAPSTPPARRPRCAFLPSSPPPTRPASRCTPSARAPFTRCRWPRTPTLGAPKIHSLGLFQPLPGRYLDIITNRVRANGDPAALTSWLAAVDQVRAKGTVPEKLPEGLGAILNPGNVNAVIEADKIDPLALAARIPAGTPVLLTCSDSDGQAKCDTDQTAHRRARAHRADGRRTQGRQPRPADDPSDNVANYSKQDHFPHNWSCA